MSGGTEGVMTQDNAQKAGGVASIANRHPLAFLNMRVTENSRSALQRQRVNLPVHLPVPGFIEKKQVTHLWEEQFLSCEAYRKCISQEFGVNSMNPWTQPLSTVQAVPSQVLGRNYKRWDRPDDIITQLH
ncbi:hypothetical protein MHYP_G00189830 [Metynnis hypsauchen]